MTARLTSFAARLCAPVIFATWASAALAAEYLGPFEPTPEHMQLIRKGLYHDINAVRLFNVYGHIEGFHDGTKDDFVIWICGEATSFEIDGPVRFFGLMINMPEGRQAFSPHAISGPTEPEREEVRERCRRSVDSMAP